MSRVAGRGRYATETYPSGAPPTFGVPDEIIRYYFSITGAAPLAPATVAPFPWTPADATGLVSVPVPPGLPATLHFILPVPPCRLGNAALTVIAPPGVTGDIITLQWRGLNGDPAPPFPPPLPLPPLGAPVNFIDPTAPLITIYNFDFSDVVVPLGGAVIFPEITLPANLNLGGGYIDCYFSVGVHWNIGLISEPFGPQP